MASYCDSCYTGKRKTVFGHSVYTCSFWNTFDTVIVQQQPAPCKTAGPVALHYAHMASPPLQTQRCNAVTTRSRSASGCCSIADDCAIQQKVLRQKAVYPWNFTYDTTHCRLTARSCAQLYAPVVEDTRRSSWDGLFLAPGHIFSTWASSSGAEGRRDLCACSRWASVGGAGALCNTRCHSASPARDDITRYTSDHNTVFSA